MPSDGDIVIVDETNNVVQVISGSIYASSVSEEELAILQSEIDTINGILLGKFDDIVTVGTGTSLIKQVTNAGVQLYSIGAGTGILPLSIVSDIIIIGVNVGINAHQIPQLDINARLPVLDGQHLYNLNASNVSLGHLPYFALNLTPGHIYIGDDNGNPADLPVSTLTLDQFGLPLGSIDIGSEAIITDTSSFAANQLVSRQYVDSVTSTAKATVKVASGTNVNISSPGSTIDSTSMSANDRVLLPNQTSKPENGVYVFNGSSSAMTRATDANTGLLLANSQFFVSSGTYAGDTWKCTNPLSLNLGTDNVTFILISSSVGSINAGNGLQIIAGVLSVLDDGTTIGITGVTNTVSVISSATAGQTLLSAGNNTLAATWGALDLSNTNAITNTLPLTHGGLGLSSIAQHSLLGAITAANEVDILSIPINSVVGRKSSGNITSLLKADLLLLCNIRPQFDSATATSSSMTLLVLSQTPSNTASVLVWLNGQLLIPTTDYTLVGLTITATSALNVSLGGTGTDGLGFANTDLVAAFYFY